jgi:hypothetical protein
MEYLFLFFIKNNKFEYIIIFLFLHYFLLIITDNKISENIN